VIPDAAETALERLRDGKAPAPPLWKESTFAGLFSQSPKVDLPGHKSVTLEHFRAERIAFDVRGRLLDADTYRWRDRLVKIVYGESGKKEALVDVDTGRQIHAYASRQHVFLQGHTEVYLEDFPLERVPTNDLGVYTWRDRTVRVIIADERLERIIDVDDGSVVYLFTEEDQQLEHLNVDLFSAEYHKLDRPASEARLARICDEFSVAGAAPFGRVHVVWPHKGPEDKEPLRHGGTVIWLHGMGGGLEVEEMASAVTQRLDMPWIKYIFPTAPMQPVTLLGGAVSSSWFDISSLSEAGSAEDAAGLERGANYIARLVQDEIVRGVAPHSVLVVGFGQGAVLAINVALRGYTWQPPPEKEVDDMESDDPDFPTTVSAMADRHAMLQAKREEQRERMLEAARNGMPLLENAPELTKLGGIALLSGWFPDCLLNLKPPWAKHLRPTYWMGRRCGKRGGVETFVAHGRADRTVPFELGKQLFKRAIKAGFSVAKLLKFSHGHGLSKHQLFELKCWIDRQIPDPEWDLDDSSLLTASSQGYTHAGALESGILPDL